uniref:Uncharacterized protein n=2 Tax=Haptolina ericina TaxID=156174 RepID=A0A7S3APN4_9EUKA|mmetsp:Transcript_28090/g.63587  ORF Transcript_28090/g.63587 Transcript_28090/m.63587 type:complete len:112 (+) Transcript_28090:303-638(+)
MDARGGMVSNVRYSSRVAGDGWLCTSGVVASDLAAPKVSIIWDRIWWLPGGEADAPPRASEGILRPIVQALGRAGFIEGLSVFPVRYLQDDLCIFNFQAFTVTTIREEFGM